MFGRKPKPCKGCIYLIDKTKCKFGYKQPKEGYCKRGKKG